VLSEALNPGPETIEARFFREEDIPWDEIAFRTVSTTLQRWFADRDNGMSDQVHAIDLV
jgi:hypothetical protein